MPRSPLILLSTLCVCLIAGCGGSSRQQASTIIIEDDAADTRTAGQAEATAGSPQTDPPEIDPAAAAAVRGESVPSRIAITVVPGIGYSVGGERIPLAELDQLLARIAKANRYADVQIRTHDNATASLIQPILDLTQQHRLVNVTLYNGG